MGIDSKVLFYIFEGCLRYMQLRYEDQTRNNGMQSIQNRRDLYNILSKLNDALSPTPRNIEN